MRSAIRLDPFPPAHPGSIAILHQQIFAKDRLWAAKSHGQKSLALGNETSF